MSFGELGIALLLGEIFWRVLVGQQSGAGNV
jgi:hypothetical protein